MERIVRITESDLTRIINKVISEQQTKDPIKNGDLLTVIKKDDKSPKPVETQALVKVIYNGGPGGMRAGIKISGQSEVQQPIDIKKMEFGDYKITKINGQPINQPVKPTPKPQPKPDPKKIVFPNRGQQGGKKIVFPNKGQQSKIKF